jgi:hypothetical protein
MLPIKRKLYTPRVRRSSSHSIRTGSGREMIQSSRERLSYLSYLV